MSLCVSSLRRLFVLAVLGSWLLSGSAHALQEKEIDEKEGMEVFEAEDPYTKGDAELVKALGYVRLGHGAWHGGDDTQALQQSMGGIEMLFVETQHFRLASSLGTYEIPNDRDERAKIKAELKRLKQKLGRLKAPKNELDPWLRLHLYAQRAEDIYAAFCAEFGLTAEEFGPLVPHMGYPEKIRLVVCQRKSEFGRYVRHYHDSTVEYSYRNVSPRDSLAVAANLEALTEGWEREDDVPFDSFLHNIVASCLTTTFMDSHNGTAYTAPRWFVYGMSHLQLRRVGPEWTYADGRQPGQGQDKDQWDWEPRVYKLVTNEFFASARDMFSWKDYADLHQRDHMISWSKTEFLVTELEGDHKAFLYAVCRPPSKYGSNIGDQGLFERQITALRECFGLTPEQFDEAWAKWVLKNYRRK